MTAVLAQPARAPGPQPAPVPPPSEPPAARLSSSLKPRVTLATTAGEGVPLGASFNPPVPAPLPERGAPTFLFVSLVAALLAVVFVFLLILQL